MTLMKYHTEAGGRRLKPHDGGTSGVWSSSKVSESFIRAFVCENDEYPKIVSVFDRLPIPMSSVSVNIFVQPEADTCSSGF